MRLYLDLCCFNRPFDDQDAADIYLETEAKLLIQRRIRDGELSLVWSFILDFENWANPDHDVAEMISGWERLADSIVQPTEEIVARAEDLHSRGFGIKDSLHLACALAGRADCFLTVDKGILRRTGTVKDLRILNPVDFFRGEG